MQNIPLIKLGIVFLPAVLLLRMADTPSSPSRAAAKRTQPEPPTSHDREKGPLNYLSSSSSGDWLRRLRMTQYEGAVFALFNVEFGFHGARSCTSVPGDSVLSLRAGQPKLLNVGGYHSPVNLGSRFSRKA
jgi:hypothetical protein